MVIKLPSEQVTDDNLGHIVSLATSFDRRIIVSIMGDPLTAEHVGVLKSALAEQGKLLLIDLQEGVIDDATAALLVAALPDLPFSNGEH